jgi:predicted small secreted protein
MNISGHMQLLKSQNPRFTRRSVSNDMAWDMMPRTVDRRQQGLPSLGPATLPLEMHMMIRILRLSLLSLPVLALLACSTVQGIGEDIQSGGQAIENTSQNLETDLKN